jgi:tetratricopeptide (TPR) repeat protein
MKNVQLTSALIVALLFGTCSTFAQMLPFSTILQRADDLIRDYQFSQALTLMDKAEDSLNVTLLQRKGLCYSKLGDYGNAIIVYEHIRRTDSLHREALYQLGQLYSLTDEYDKAMSFFQTLIDVDSTNSFYFKQYASVAVKAEDLIAGIAGYLQVVTLNPHDIEAYAQLSKILLDAKQYDFVDSMLFTVLSTTENRQLRWLQVRANLGQEDYEAVVENTEKLISTGDTTVSYARVIGISYFQLDQHSKVIPFMELLLKNGIKADWIFYYLGVSYQQVNEPLKGIHFLNMAIEEGISNNIVTYYTQLGMAYEEVKDFKNAIRTYKAAYQHSKADILLYHLARNYDVYYKDKTQAQVYYKKYLDSDDTLKIAKNYSRHRLDILSALK